MRVLMACLCLMVACPSVLAADPGGLPSPEAARVLTARIVAVGIPGAGAVAGIGFFHKGGPIHDKPEFAAVTQPGRMLDPKRVLVASRSNFGAPRALAEAPEGAVLSIDPDGATIVVPAGFAARGDQAAAMEGRLQLFTAQSPAFINGINTPGAATASLPGVSEPLGISINNAFGRLWFANAPQGAVGAGLESILDPGGQPLANAPSRLAGGVFSGMATNRPQQLITGGLRTGAVANALLGMSPDGSKRAVFAVLTADGAVAQAHTEQAVDGLAPPGTVGAMPVPAAEGALVTRAGMAFNWVPDRLLYITDPVRNAIIVLKLGHDDKVFTLEQSRMLMLPQLAAPIDIAPAIPEVANAEFASNTSLAGGADLYVLNRGNGTIVRLRQDGTPVAIRRIATNSGAVLGAARLNGIAVSPDAAKIWVTVSGALPEYPDAPGALLEVPTFGLGRAASLMPSGPALAVTEPAAGSLIARGAALFSREFTPAEGLGPLFNKRACLGCHSQPEPGGAGDGGLAIVHRVGWIDGEAFDPLIGAGGPVARAHSIAELGLRCTLAPGPPPRANLISARNAPALFGLGLVNLIPDEAIRAGAEARRSRGRPNLVRDATGRERTGRFGWKADVAELEQFVADAFRDELGITSPLAPTDLVAPPADCGSAAASAPKDDGSMVRAVTAYVAALPAPRSNLGQVHKIGERLFAAIGCADCHVPELSAGDFSIPLYSDLLLHDMGASLDDAVIQGRARGSEWRTTPLWGLGGRNRFLHDGRATSIADAILAHGGEAAPAAASFRRLGGLDRDALVAFLAAL